MRIVQINKEKNMSINYLISTAIKFLLNLASGVSIFANESGLFNFITHSNRFKNNLFERFEEKNMQVTSKLILILTFTTVFSFNAFSQNSENELTQKQTIETETIRTDEEILEEKQVQKFVESFIKEMDEKKDINKVSEKFFVANFTETFAKNRDWETNVSRDFHDELIEELKFDELYQTNSEWFNFIFLEIMCLGGNDYSFDDESENDSNNAIIKRVFPVEVIDLMSSNKRLSKIFDLNNFDEEKIIEYETLNEINLFNSALKSVNEAITKYIETRPTSWNETFKKRSVEYRKKEDYFKKEVCKEEDCEDLQENTIIYTVASFPFIFLVTNEVGENKVLNIYLPGN